MLDILTTVQMSHIILQFPHRWTHNHTDKYVDMYYNSIFIYIKIYIQKLIKGLCLSSFNHTTLPPLNMCLLSLSIINVYCTIFLLPLYDFNWLIKKLKLYIQNKSAEDYCTKSTSIIITKTNHEDRKKIK